MSIMLIEDMINYNHEEKTNFMINNLLLNNTSIVLSATPKSGKTTLVLQLMNAICNDIEFLDVKKGSYNVDSIVFFSNDSTQDSISIKLSKINFNSCNIKIYFIFDKNITVDELVDKLKQVVNKDERVLLVVDVLAGLRMKNQFDLNNYTSMTDTIDYLEENLKQVASSFGVILVHHLNKKNSCLGSTAIESRVSAKLKMHADTTNNEYAKLVIEANDYESRTIYIKQDKKHYKWVIDKDQNSASDDDLDFQLLKINEAIARTEKKFISGTVNEIIALTRVTISPRKFTKFLKKNKRYLKQNNIEFKIRKSNTTIIEMFIKN